MWLIYAVAASILWGLIYSLSEKIFRYEISPQTLLALQMCFGGVIFLLLSFNTTFKKDMSLIFSNRILLIILICELIAVIVANYLISLSIQAKDATLAGLIEQSYPIFTVIFTWIIFRESHLTRGVIVGSIMIFLGIVVMVYF